MTTNHFTAWLVNNASCLAQDNCDVTVLADEAVSYTQDDNGNETPVWGSTGDPLFYAITDTPAKDGKIDEALQHAWGLLDSAGWTLIGEWEAVDNGYTITVERA